eukprot:8393071-Pyramimonas_sp.AAC.1
MGTVAGSVGGLGAACSAVSRELRVCGERGGSSCPAGRSVRICQCFEGLCHGPRQWACSTSR